MKQKSAPERKLWAQFNALEMGSGWDETDIEKPQILIEDVYGDSHPGVCISMSLPGRRAWACWSAAAFRRITIRLMYVTDVHRVMME